MGGNGDVLDDRTKAKLRCCKRAGWHSMLWRRLTIQKNYNKYMASHGIVKYRELRKKNLYPNHKRLVMHSNRVCSPSSSLCTRRPTITPERNTFITYFQLNFIVIPGQRFPATGVKCVCSMATKPAERVRYQRIDVSGDRKPTIRISYRSLRNNSGERQENIL